MWNTVLFDLDGTLSDSAPGITRCVQYASEKELNSLYPGIPELLQQLRNENFTIALCSSKPEEFCIQILESFHIAQYFDLVCGSDMEGKHTDKAEIMENVIHRLGMEGRRDEVVMVGDRRYDIIGAKQRGIGSIGVSYGYGSREELEYEWPDCIVDTVTELRNVLIGQARAGRRRVLSPDSPGGKAARNAADGSVLFRAWRVGYPLLLHFGISNLTMIVIGSVIMLSAVITGEMMSAGLDMIGTNTVLFTGIADAIVVPIAWLFFRNDERKRAASTFAERLLIKNTFGVLEVVCIAVMIIGFTSVLNLLISMIPLNDETYNSLAEEMFRNTGFITQFIVIGIIAPITEELIFRGLIYRRMRDYTGVLWGVIFSGLVFGVYHGNLTQGIFAFIIGMMFAALYEHYGTMWAPIAGHMANNMLATVENYLLERVDVPDWLYLLMIGVMAVLGVACLIRILKREKRVNEL